jgi:hypothetical protein
MTKSERQDPKFQVPTGLPHIAMIVRINQHNRTTAQSLLKSRHKNLDLLGRALHVLYLAATCHRKCWGGGHVMEFMAAPRLLSVFADLYRILR